MFGNVEDKFQNLRSKMTFVGKHDRIGDLANKHASIIQFCPKSSIVVDMRAHEFLIGQQVFKLINAVYSSQPDVWVTYSKGMKVEDKLSLKVYKVQNE